MADRIVFTIGHSTREADELAGLLGHHGVRSLVDVRRYPASRRYPWFNREPLRDRLAEDGVAYRHEPDMGGRRDGLADSPNQGIRNAGFRAYADHMDSPEFQAALDRVIDEAGRTTVAIMCAESVPWRCHRNLISDALVGRGVQVRHILGADPPRPHELHAAARVDDRGRVRYPPRDDPSEQPDLF